MFSTVFGFRRTEKQIFSELEKETILRIFTPEDSRSPKGSSRGATGGPHLTQACTSLAGRAWPRCGHLSRLRLHLFAYLITPDGKTLNIAQKVQKEVRSRRHRRG